MPVRVLGGAVVDIFRETAPHMRGTVTPPPRGGGTCSVGLYIQ